MDKDFQLIPSEAQQQGATHASIELWTILTDTKFPAEACFSIKFLLN